MENYNLFDRVRRDLLKRRERSLSGKLNCIPFKLPRFSNELPGIEQGTYSIVTANSKIGKKIKCPFT